MPFLAGILCLRLLAAPAAAAVVPAPAAYQPVLDRRALDAERLLARGFVFDGGKCFRTDASGRKTGPALTPEELDAALGPRDARAAAGGTTRAPRRSALALKLDQSLHSLGKLYDGAASEAADAVVKAPPPPPLPAAPRPPHIEEPFTGSWAKIQAQLRDPKTSAAGLRALGSHFRKDSDSPTGLSAGAPEALRLVTLTVHDGQGGTAARVELKRELTLAANIPDTKKFDFAHTLTSPLTVYTALGRSESSHSLDSQLYFRRMDVLLTGDGLTLSSFIDYVDPQGRDAQQFLLRANAYDALIPYLLKHPGEAGNLAPRLFPDGRNTDIRAHASQLEGFLTQLAEQGRKSGAFEYFVSALLAEAGTCSDETAKRIAVYLKVNEHLLAKKDRTAVDELAERLPPGLLEKSGLVPPEPYDSWPAGPWTFVLHFASTDTFRGWQRQFEANGYRPVADDEGATLTKTFGSQQIFVRGRLYPGDKEGFMRGAVARRFLSDVARDLRDPSVQGVILRNHSQFKISNLFGKGVTPDKLILDGACRSAWDLQTLRRACPTCSFIVNTGTGHTHQNSAASLSVIEGIAQHKPWSEIGADWTRLSPAAASIQGPWTPPYSEALSALDASERAPDTKK